MICRKLDYRKRIASLPGDPGCVQPGTSDRRQHALAIEPHRRNNPVHRAIPSHFISAATPQYRSMQRPQHSAGPLALYPRMPAAYPDPTVRR